MTRAFGAVQVDQIGVRRFEADLRMEGREGGGKLIGFIGDVDGRAFSVSAAARLIGRTRTEDLLHQLAHARVTGIPILNSVGGFRQPPRGDERATGAAEIPETFKRFR